jgi:hypothetical protein
MLVGLPLAGAVSACALVDSFAGFTGGTDASAGDGGGNPGSDAAGRDSTASGLDASDAAAWNDSPGDGPASLADAEAASEAATDAATDAAPHVIFVTSQAYTGNLVAQADGLIEAGVFQGPDGGAFGPGDGVAAADALCQNAAAMVGLSGTYWAFVNASTGADIFGRLKDTDGPWALTDGTPVADTVRELQTGQLRHDVDLDEYGIASCSGPFGPSSAGSNCENWSAGSDPEGGILWASLGGCASISTDWLSTGLLADCANGWQMYCLGVGPGAGPNRYPALPQGAKIAFVTPPRAPDFAASFTADAGSYGAAHAAADAICAAQAAGAGMSGTFRAFVATSAASAVDYFAANNMDGPWYRSDGLPIAANRAALAGSSPIGAQIALLPSGQFAANLTEVVMT